MVSAATGANGFGAKDSAASADPALGRGAARGVDGGLPQVRRKLGHLTTTSLIGVQPEEPQSPSLSLIYDRPCRRESFRRRPEGRSRRLGGDFGQFSCFR